MEEKKPKKRINSKQKGNGFEGQVAKKLTTSLAPLTFLRSPSSGARTGGKNFELYGKMFGEDAMKLFTGDVVPTNEKDVGLKFKWSIECKSYKTPDNFPALISGKANLFSWFEEAKVDAVKVDRFPMLIFKWNQTPTFVAINHSAVQNYSLPDYNIVDVKLTISKDNHWLDIYLLDDLLQDKKFWAAA